MLSGEATSTPDGWDVSRATIALRPYRGPYAPRVVDIFRDGERVATLTEAQLTILVRIAQGRYP
jgi:hypothetical protein